MADERGRLILETTFGIAGVDLPVVAATGIEYASDLGILAESQNPIASLTVTDSIKDTCVFSPSLCSIGLSICFWLQSKFTLSIRHKVFVGYVVLRIYGVLCAFMGRVGVVRCGMVLRGEVWCGMV